MFLNREDAGLQLAQELKAYANRMDAIVLGIPRGGVVVASEVAGALNLPLDIFVSRKLGVPAQEELAFGAIATGDTRILDRDLIEAIGISGEQIEQITARTKKELKRRESIYRGDRPPLDVRGATVLLVDDGIATGSSMLAAIRALRQLKPARIVVAVPVAPSSTCNRLKPEVDELVCIEAPREFNAIGQFYEDFSQVADQEVIHLLHQAEERVVKDVGEPNLDPPPAQQSSKADPDGRSTWHGGKSEISLELQDATLQGTLFLPDNAEGIVLFAHGSGSSRYSPRNRYVAEVLNSNGIATLLFDLLTRQEESIDQYSGELRFDIPFLTKRLIGATKCIRGCPETSELKIAYFGASTGAGAALAAAAELPEIVSAVVSRGGRPDLANEALSSVRAPTLLIVGGEDESVVRMNREALEDLHCEKELIVVPGATHLFEEPGTLEEVARLAADWFSQQFRLAKQAELGPVHH